MHQGLWNAFDSPLATAGNQYDRAVDIANGDFSKQFEGLSPQEYSRQLGLLSGEALGTGLQLAYTAYSIGRGMASAGVNATKLFWNNLAKTTTKGLGSRVAEVAKPQFANLAESFFVQKGALGATRKITTSRRMADFIAGPTGVTIPTSRSVLEAGFVRASFESFLTDSPGVGYILSNKMIVRIMERSGKAPLRASFTNANGGPINPFTERPPQPPKGLSREQRLEFTRKYTHIELTK